MSTDDNRCNRCGGFKSERGAPSSSGRITQWVFACTCALEAQEEKPGTVATVICRLCGKSVQQGRVGSFTQWVFRSDLCSCAIPEPVVTEVARPIAEEEAVVPDDDEPELKIGSDKFPLDRYKPISIIGTGASGVVYHCIDRLLKKRVAIKALHYIDPALLVSFQQEAKTTSNLSHNNVVKILDFGATASGSPYMVMDLVDGVDLRSLIEEHGPLNQAQVLYLTRKVALGLAHAHAQGILHRDVKSSNILVARGEYPEPIIIDFGVAQFMAKESPPTAAGTGLVGSPLYMAPDQALGHEYDERSEIYSIGCCMFEALTAVVPFKGDTALETMSLHARSPAPQLADAFPEGEFLEELEQVVATCLQKNPEDRFQNAEELARALEEILASEALRAKEISNPVVSQAQSTMVPGEQEKDKNAFKRLAVLITVASVIVVACLSTVIWNRTFTVSQQPKTKLMVDGLDNFGHAVVNSLPDAKKGPMADSIDWSIVSDDPEQPAEDKPTGGTFSPQMMGGKLTYHGSGGEVTDKDFAQLSGKKMHGIFVRSRYVTGLGFKYLKSSGIQIIGLSNCMLSEEGLKEISKVKSISHVNFDETTVNDQGIAYITKLPLLEAISATKTDITDKGIAHIRQCKNLTMLVLSGTRITAAGITSLADMPRLNWLEISQVDLPSDLAGIENLSNLVVLIANDTRLGDRTVARITKLKKLKRLRLDKSKITDFSLSMFQKMKSLQTISFTECDGISIPATDRFRRNNPHLSINSD